MLRADRLRISFLANCVGRHDTEEELLGIPGVVEPLITYDECNWLFDEGGVDREDIAIFQSCFAAEVERREREWEAMELLGTVRSMRRYLKDPPRVPAGAKLLPAGGQGAGLEAGPASPPPSGPAFAVVDRADLEHVIRLGAGAAVRELHWDLPAPDASEG